MSGLKAIFNEDEIERLYADEKAYCLGSPRDRPGAPQRPLVVRGEGAYFWDARGKKYVDFTAQVFNVNVGMGNRKVIEAMKRQLDALPYTNFRYLSLPKIELAKRLAKIMPGDLCQTFFSSGGGDANDSAIKIAQMYKATPKLIGLWDAYHGATYATVSIGGSASMRSVAGLSIFEEFKHIPAPYCYRCAFGRKYPECGLQCVQFLEYTIAKEQPVAAFMAEPVSCYAGMAVPPKEYWPMVRRICNEKGILLILDEVMTGFARTGKMFACEHWDIVPDIMTLAKGITAGYAPLGATVVTKRLADYIAERGFPHYYTYGGHALACATALAVIDYYTKENVVEKAAKMGNYMTKELHAMEERHHVIGDIRALGFMIGVELVANRQTKEPLEPKNLTKEQIGDPKYNPIAYLQELALDKGLALALAPGTCIIRLLPTLVITKEQVDEGLKILEDVIAAVEKRFNLPKKQ